MAGPAEGQGAGNISRAVVILRTAVNQQHAIAVKLAIGVIVYTVMYYGAMRATAADCVKTNIVQQFCGCTKALKLFNYIYFAEAGFISRVKPG